MNPLRQRGPVWTPITPKTGALFHADSHQSKVFGTVEFEIDDGDAAAVSAYRWHVLKRRKVFYVRGTIDGKGVLLHRFLTGASPNMTVDHIDGNPLNNRRSNLRVCSNEENVKAAWDRGAFDDKLAKKTFRNSVKKRLADGTVKVYVYDVRDHESWEAKRERRRKTTN